LEHLLFTCTGQCPSCFLKPLRRERLGRDCFRRSNLRPDPEVHWSPTERDMPNLGARVLSLRSDLGVPFGLRGFIVAVHGKFVEVAFDRRFMTGTTLNGRCAERCGKVLPMAALLNLSQPRVLRPRSMSSGNIAMLFSPWFVDSPFI